MIFFRTTVKLLREGIINDPWALLLAGFGDIIIFLACIGSLVLFWG